MDRHATAQSDTETAIPHESSAILTANQTEVVISKPKPVVSPPHLQDPAYVKTQKWWDECDKRGFKYESNFTPEASKSFLQRSAIALKWNEGSDIDLFHVDMMTILPIALTANAETNFSHLALGNVNKFYDDSNSIQISVHNNLRKIHKFQAGQLHVEISHIPTDILNEMEKILERPCGDSFYLNHSYIDSYHSASDDSDGDAEQFAALMTVLRYRPTASSGEFNHYINIDLESLSLVFNLPLDDFSSEVEEHCVDMKTRYLGIIDGGNTSSGDSDDSEDD